MKLFLSALITGQFISLLNDTKQSTQVYLVYAGWFTIEYISLIALINA